MDPTRVVFGFTLLLFSIYLSTIDSCEIYKFVESEDQALEDHVITTIVRILVSVCWAKCAALSWCFSINVRPTNHGTIECDLNNSSKRANPGNLVSSEGLQYPEFGEVDDNHCSMYECKRKEDLGDGWFRYGKAAMKFFQEIKNWTDARVFCQSLGGDLVSILNSIKNDFGYDVFVKALNLTYGEREMEFPDVCWKFNGQEQGMIFYRTPGNVRYESDGGENALFFAGKDEYADIPAVPFNPEGFTITLWIKHLNPSTQYPQVFYAFSSQEPIVQIYTSEDRIDSKLNGEYMGANRCPYNVWCHLAFTWNKTEHLFRTVLSGKTERTKSPAVSNAKTSATRFLFGREYVRTSQPFHGYLKHFMVFNKTLSNHEVQTAMYWHEQGVWIGLNNQANSNVFQWSDGTPVSQFMPLPSYNPKPVSSGRKCAATISNRKWLDKHCLEKKPFICQRPAP